jgi:heavy metal sensor kinase
MNLSPRSVRSRLTLWYVVALSVLLLSYAAGALFVLFLNMREQRDHNLLEDVETVKEQIKSQSNGSIALELHHGEEGDPGLHRFVEIWSPEGSLLYRTPQLQGQALGAPPIPGEGTGRLRPASERLPNGLRVRVASSAYVIGPRRVILRVANNEQNLWRELRELATVLIIGLPIGVLLAGFGGYVLARKALAPIDAMAEQAETISAERMSERLSIRDPEDELGRLATVFNAMLARLQGAFDQLRRFTADASHELRTPLTAIRSVGEVALQNHKSQTEYRDVIGSMLEEVDRLTRLVESLLTLSRADAGHVQLQCAHRSLLTLALEARSLVEVLAEEKHQMIDVECHADLIVSADRLILRQAIVNLLDNAIKYSPANSRIVLRVARATGNRATLDVIDQGPGIPVEHQPYIFDRFYRVDKARTREWGGAGLGLSITRWAVEAHGGKVTFLSREEGGSKFRVSLPLIATKPSSNVTAEGAQ